MPQTCHQPSVRDAAQFLIGLCEAHPDARRLTSLLYLADRLSMKTYGYTVSEDRFACTDGVPHGVGTRRIVSSLVARRPPPDEHELGMLSVASENILRTTHNTYGSLDDDELARELRTLPEAVYEGPISYRMLADSVCPDDPEGLAYSLDQDRSLRWCLDGLRC